MLFFISYLVCHVLYFTAISQVMEHSTTLHSLTLSQPILYYSIFCYIILRHITFHYLTLSLLCHTSPESDFYGGIFSCMTLCCLKLPLVTFSYLEGIVLHCTRIYYIVRYCATFYDNKTHIQYTELPCLTLSYIFSHCLTLSYATLHYQYIHICIYTQLYVHVHIYIYICVYCRLICFMLTS